MKLELTEEETTAVILSLAVGQKSFSEDHFIRVREFVLNAKLQLATAHLVLVGELATDATGDEITFRATTANEKEYITRGMKS